MNEKTKPEAQLSEQEIRAAYDDYLSRRQSEADIVQVAEEALVKLNLSKEDGRIVQAILNRLAEIIPNDAAMLTLQTAVGSVSYRRNHVKALSVIQVVMQAKLETDIARENARKALEKAALN